MGKVTIEKFLQYNKIKDVRNLITKPQYDQLDRVFLFYDTKTIKNRLQNIRDFIINNVETNWVGRLKIITKKLKNDVISEYSCKIRYGDKWKEKRETLKDKVRMDKNNFIKKYGEEEGVRRWEERNIKVISYGLKPAIMRYGEVEGKKKWENTLFRKNKTMYETKKIRPYRNGRTLVEYQKRYGVEIGYRKWIDRNNKQKYRFSLNYYTDKFGQELGVQEWEKYCESMRKTTLDSFIARYGKDTGIDRYDKFLERIKFTQSEQYYINKYGEKEGKYKYKESLISKISYFKDCYSKISQDLFWNVFDRLNEDDRKKCFFYELNHEYPFYIWEKGMTVIKIDFKMGDRLIEFDGDYWHSKEEQKQKDNMRDDYLIKKGYNIKRVKEIDYRTNKDLVITECLEFLK
jgi:hypothetical protein